MEFNKIYLIVTNCLLENIGLISLVLFFISIIMIFCIYLKNKSKIFTEVTWIYSSLMPAVIIVFLNHTENLFLILLFFCVQICFIVLYIKDIEKNYKKLIGKTTTNNSKIKTIVNKDLGGEKSLEYVGLFILPFITVNESINPITIIFIVTLVVYIIRRFDLYYLNFSILFFYRIQYIETNREIKKIVLTPRNFTFVSGEEYKIRNFIDSLKLYIYIP